MGKQQQQGLVIRHFLGALDTHDVTPPVGPDLTLRMAQAVNPGLALDPLASMALRRWASGPTLNGDNLDARRFEVPMGQAAVLRDAERGSGATETPPCATSGG